LADIVSPEKRSRMMSGIRGKDTKPELLIRKALHARGLRFRLHAKDLPGKPDLVLPKYRAVIFVNGCFFHGHDCHLFKLPATRPDFWREKIEGNRQRDKATRVALDEAGWRHLTVWECALKGKTKKGINDVIDAVSEWIITGTSGKNIRGRR